MPETSSGKRRPRGASLQPVVGVLFSMQSVDGSLRSILSGECGGKSVTPSIENDTSYSSTRGQLQAGSLAGVVRPRKGNKGA